jgi:hypothetical protein
MWSMTASAVTPLAPLTTEPIADLINKRNPQEE